MLATGSDFNVSHTQTALRPRQPRLQADGSLEAHLERGSVRGIEAKEHIFTEGEPKTFVYKVLTGAVCLYRVLPDGRRQVIDFAYPGDLIGLGSGPVEEFNAQATVSTRVKCLPTSSLRAAVHQQPQVAIRLYEAISHQLAAMQDHLVCVGQRSATERLSGFLLGLSRRNEQNGMDPQVVELRITRNDIADFLGLKIETVSRTFTKLRSLGFIEIHQGTTIRLVDIKRLEAVGGGEASI